MTEQPKPPTEAVLSAMQLEIERVFVAGAAVKFMGKETDFIGEDVQHVDCPWPELVAEAERP